MPLLSTYGTPYLAVITGLLALQFAGRLAPTDVYGGAVSRGLKVWEGPDVSLRGFFDELFIE